MEAEDFGSSCCVPCDATRRMWPRARAAKAPAKTGADDTAADGRVKSAVRVESQKTPRILPIVILPARA